MARTEFINAAGVNLTIWRERPGGVIKVCTGDPRFADPDGGRPGLWIQVKPGCSAYNRLDQALAEAQQTAQPVA